MRSFVPATALTLLAACVACDADGAIVAPITPPSAPAPPPPPPPAPPGEIPVGAIRISVDGATRFQTIDGWATFTRMWEEDKINNRYDASIEPYTGAVGAYLVNSVGINAVRLEIVSGWENPRNDWPAYYAGTMPYTTWSPGRYEKVNDNADPNVANLAGFQFGLLDYRVERMLLPMKAALEARGERLHINVNYVDFNWNQARQGTLSHANNPQEYAEFVLVMFQHLRTRYGLIPDSFEMILEPENTLSWRGADIGRALVAVSDRLRADGFTPEIIAPSTTAMSGALPYFNGLLTVPGAVTRMSTLAYHRYGGESVANLLAIRAAAQTHGLKTAMLEKVNAGIDVLMEDLTVGQVSSWQQWAMAGTTASSDGGAFYARVNVSQSGPSAITSARLTNQLAHVFLYARLGAVRVQSQSDSPDKATVAFVNPDGSHAVVVRAKTTGGLIAVEGLPAGRYGIRITTNQGVTTYPTSVTLAAGGYVPAQLLGAGVVTVYQTP